MTPTLFGLAYSPWTERARWALDHHGVVYDYREHVPMLGEVFLRRKARSKKATVPLLVAGDDAVMGSLEIARYVENTGRGASLFPGDGDAAMTRWVDVAERMLGVGRAWVLKRLLKSKEAQVEALPTFIPAVLRGVLAPTAGMGTRFIAKKYDVSDDVDAQVEHALRPLLVDVRAALESRPYFLATSTFSFADIVLATTMQVLRPHENAKLGPATREVWTNEALAREFADLLEWRDMIYGKHR